MTGLYVLYGGIVLYVAIIAFLDWSARSAGPNIAPPTEPDHHFSGTVISPARPNQCTDSFAVG